MVQLTLLATVKLDHRPAAGPELGVSLACATLTRHVGGAVAAAVLIELWFRGRARAAAVAGLTCLALLTPWIVWLASTPGATQADLLPGRGGLPALVVSQAVFYTRRIPDALTGPAVEIATVFRPTGPVSLLANLWAVGATGLILVGLAKTLKTPRRRLAGLSAGATGALLLAWPFTEAGRFLIPLVPCLLVGATEGLALVLSRLKRVRRPRGIAAALVLAATLPYSVYALATDRAGAQRRTHAGIDAACRWIAHEGAGRPGPVLTRYPGEVYWQTGRTALGPPADGPDAVARVIRRYGVAYLIVDEAPFADALPSPLSAFLKAEPGAARLVWKADAGRPPVAVYAVDQGFAGPSNVRVP